MKLNRIFAPITAAALCLSLSGCTLVDRVNAGAYTEGDATITSQISKIDIDWPQGSVYVVGTGSDEISVSEKNLTQDKLAYRIIGSVLYIKAAKPGIEAGEKQLTVKIPADVRFNEVEVRSKSADINLRNVTLDRADLLSRTGDISLVACKIDDEAELDSDTGDVTLFENTINDYDIETKTGPIKVVASTSPTDLDLRTVEADITLVLPEDTAFSPDIKTQGEITNEFEGTKGHSFTFKSTTGNVEITKK